MIDGFIDVVQGNSDYSPLYWLFAAVVFVALVVALYFDEKNHNKRTDFHIHYAFLDDFIESVTKRVVIKTMLAVGTALAWPFVAVVCAVGALVLITLFALALIVTFAKRELIS